MSATLNRAIVGPCCLKPARRYSLNPSNLAVIQITFHYKTFSTVGRDVPFFGFWFESRSKTRSQGPEQPAPRFRACLDHANKTHRHERREFFLLGLPGADTRQQWRKHLVLTASATDVEI